MKGKNDKEVISLKKRAWKEIILSAAATGLFIVLVLLCVPKAGKTVVLTGESEGEMSRSDLVLSAAVYMLGTDAPEEAVKSTCAVLSAGISRGERLGIVDAETLGSALDGSENGEMYRRLAREYGCAWLLRDGESVDTSAYDAAKAVELADRGCTCEQILAFFFPRAVLIY